MENRSATKAISAFWNRGFCTIENNTKCNRDCSYCIVPQQYEIEKQSTVAQTCDYIDYLVKNKFKILNYVGGEPLAPFKTKEGITFLDHTLQTIKHATACGMITNVTTNGDYVTTEILQKLAETGLDSLTFSLHTYTVKALDKLLEKAKAAAKLGIVPIVHIVFTEDRADTIPLALARVAEAGVLGSTTIVQEKGGGFSATPEESKIPSTQQQKEVFAKLQRIKNYGFIRNNRNYLEHAPDFPNNSWHCDPDVDRFIHIGAGGKADICSDVRTPLNILDVILGEKKWRDIKKDLAMYCENCLYSCYYETENPNFQGDIATFLVMALIRTGHADIVEKWGKFAVKQLAKDEEFDYKPLINEKRIPQRIFLSDNVYYGGIAVVPITEVEEDEQLVSSRHLQEYSLDIVNGQPVYMREHPFSKTGLLAFTLVGSYPIAVSLAEKISNSQEIGFIAGMSAILTGLTIGIKGIRKRNKRSKKYFHQIKK